MFNKKQATAWLLGGVSSLLVGCGALASGGADAQGIRLAHNLGTVHPVHQSLMEFQDLVNDQGDFGLQLFADGVLGDEREIIEMVQAGLLEFARVSAGNLEPFAPIYQIFSLPYSFVSQDHLHQVMNHSQAVRDIWASTYDQGFVGIGWFDSGQRSIYLNDYRVVQTPADLSGLAIRTLGSPTAMGIINAMGATATPMPFGEVYSGLQQGIIDGAENNETALTLSSHGEVASVYVYTMHQMIPDILIVSTQFWDGLTTAQQEMFRDAAAVVSGTHRTRWDQSVREAVTIAEEEMGVIFRHIDITPFIDATQSIRDGFMAASDENRHMLEAFRSFAN